ncbi:hypothetical protein [Aureimonas psammosilenae]|uniref:hypothetical protein n=1 Tax=Aureimonas psammosilenae TaxID=2495496 RepID=UPI001260B7DE|nr:hypothetical protein [Aureimonas psammosilenae]
MRKEGVTRRDVLKASAALALTAASEVGASTADLRVFSKRHLTIFRNYADRAFSGGPKPVKDRLGAPDDDSRVLWISDLSPSTFAHRHGLALIRPAVLELMPAAVIADLLKTEGPVVLSAPSMRAGPGLELWRPLADLMAMPETPLDVFLDLGGSGDDETVHGGVDLLRRTYGRRSTDWIAVTCPQGPALRIG